MKFQVQVEDRIDRVAAHLRAELGNERETRFRALNGTLHGELREQTRVMVGGMTALWTALLIPIARLWIR